MRRSVFICAAAFVAGLGNCPAPRRFPVTLADRTALQRLPHNTAGTNNAGRLFS